MNLKREKSRLLALLMLVTATVLFPFCAKSEILVYKWKINGSEYYSATGDKEAAVLRKYAPTGFLTVEYNDKLQTYSNANLVSYWKDPTDKKPYYFEDDFLYGIANFEIIQVAGKNSNADYLRISAFWGGMLGETYSGIIKPFNSSKIGSSNGVISIAPALKGFSSWDKTYTTGETSQGGGTVQLSLDTAWSKFANQNKLTVSQTVTEIVAAVKKSGYSYEAPKTVINTPAIGEVCITGGTINGTIIGNKDPRDGTFITLKAGFQDKTGKLILHSGTTGFEALFKTPDDMEEDTVWILPPNMGQPGQVLTTDGKGNLSWTDKGGGPSSINIVNGGTEGFGVFDSNSKTSDKNEYIFRNIAANSEKIDVNLTNRNILIDLNENKINRGNLSGTQTASTISDFQEAVLQNPNVFLSNTNATTAPSSKDDATKGYSAGSLWIDQTTKTIYLCSNPTPDAAEWKDISPTYQDFLQRAKNLSDLTDIAAARANLGLSNVQNIKNNLEADREPRANDDSIAGYSIGSIWINTTTKRTYVCVKNNAGSAIWQLLTAGLTAGLPSTSAQYINSNLSGWY
ncbi:MAG: hypothetical protein QXH80_01110 [Candidatus Nanoarchaeia archaeon]